MKWLSSAQLTTGPPMGDEAFVPMQSDFYTGMQNSCICAQGALRAIKSTYAFDDSNAML